METLAPARSCHDTIIRLRTTRETAFIDLTDGLGRIVADTRVTIGTINVQTTHTTTALVVNEHETQLLSDFLALLDRAVPRSATYAHDNLARRPGVPPDEPCNGHAHCRALLLPSSATLNIVGGRLRLGRWQRVFLVELDGPREREVSVVVVGETGL